jgi:hypothetical protein
MQTYLQRWMTHHLMTDEQVFLKGCTAAKVPFLMTFWMDFAADLAD